MIFFLLADRLYTVHNHNVNWIADSSGLHCVDSLLFYLFANEFICFIENLIDI